MEEKDEVHKDDFYKDLERLYMKAPKCNIMPKWVKN